MLTQDPRTLFHYLAPGEFLPQGEVLPHLVLLEKVDFSESVEHFHLALPLLDRHENGLVVGKVGDPSSANGHILLLVTLIERGIRINGSFLFTWSNSTILKS